MATLLYVCARYFGRRILKEGVQNLQRLEG